MGEIADMMLEGDLCEGCGSYIDDEGGEGFPRYCSPECAAGRGMTYQPPATRTSAKARKAQRINRQRQESAGPKPFECPVCSKRFRMESSVAQHKRDAHPTGNNFEVPF